MSTPVRPRDRFLQLGLGVALLALLELLARAFVPLPDVDRYRFFRLHGADGFVFLAQQPGVDPVGFVGLTQTLLQDDPLRLWRLRPDLDLDATSLSLGPPRPWHVTTNAQGWRGPLAGTGDPAPVVALGDSCTFGWGVDDAVPFPALLDDALPSRVYNRGVPGWSSIQGASLAAELDQELDPSVVVVAFGGNDGHQVPRDDRDWLARRASTLGQLQHQVSRLRLVLLARHHAYPLWARAQGMLWQAGGMVPRADPVAFAHALEQMIAIAPHAVVVDVCANRPYSGAMDELARSDPRVRLVRYRDVHGETLDGCHPTPAGHRALAQALLEVWPR